MNWKELEFIDFKINRKTGKKYHQQYLKPSYYLEIYLRWTDSDAISNFYDAVLEKLGNDFTYHHHNKKSRESKFKDQKTAFGYFTDFLKSDKKYCWFQLSNNGGIGNAKEVGGVGDALFEAWVHKAPKNQEEQNAGIDRYKKLLAEFHTDMLPQGIPISKISVSFPLSSFKSTDDFKNWILNTHILKEGTFFSGTAGYRINFWAGYVNENAQQKLKQILNDYPGLEADISIGNAMGRFLNEYKSDIIPVVKRLNWLNFISREGVALLGDFEGFKMNIEKTGFSKIYRLKNGICIQTSKEPAISKNEEGFEQYFEIYENIKRLGYKSHPRDHYGLTGKDDSAVKEWLYKYADKGY